MPPAFDQVSDLGRRDAVATTTCGKTSKERPGTPICTSSRVHTIHIWLIPFHESVAPAACFVYVPGEAASLPRIPMAVLMECTDVSFTNQQRSVTAARARNYWASTDVAAHNWSLPPVIFGYTRRTVRTNVPSRKAPTNVCQTSVNIRKKNLMPSAKAVQAFFNSSQIFYLII